MIELKVIYADTLFLINALVDYLLLLCSARLSGEPLRRGHFILGAALGGGYAVALFLPGMEWLYHPVCRLSAAVLMVLIAFFQSRRLLRQSVIFFALSCAFGGGVFVVAAAGEKELYLTDGVYYAPVDIKILLVSAAGCYLVLSLVFQRLYRHSGGERELERVTLSFQEKKIDLMALIDTGNTLTDPITGKSVLVVDGRYLEDLFKVTSADYLAPLEGIKRLNDTYPGRFRLVPYRAVGVDRGVLLAVRLDEVRIGDRVEQGVLAAASPTPVSDGGNYQVLAGKS